MSGISVVKWRIVPYIAVAGYRGYTGLQRKGVPSINLFWINYEGSLWISTIDCRHFRKIKKKVNSRTWIKDPWEFHFKLQMSEISVVKLSIVPYIAGVEFWGYIGLHRKGVLHKKFLRISFIYFWLDMCTFKWMRLFIWLFYKTFLGYLWVAFINPNVLEI